MTQRTYDKNRGQIADITLSPISRCGEHSCIGRNTGDVSGSPVQVPHRLVNKLAHPLSGSMTINVFELPMDADFADKRCPLAVVHQSWFCGREKRLSSKIGVLFLSRVRASAWRTDRGIGPMPAILKRPQDLLTFGKGSSTIFRDWDEDGWPIWKLLGCVVVVQRVEAELNMVMSWT